MVLKREEMGRFLVDCRKQDVLGGQADKRVARFDGSRMQREEENTECERIFYLFWERLAEVENFSYLCKRRKRLN